MTIEVYDSEGTLLKVGDKVKIQEKRNNGLTFYTTVQVINGQLFPFNKFCFDRIVKVDLIPEGCSHSPQNIENSFPEYWMHPNEELHLVEADRLSSWRDHALRFEYNPFFKVLLSKDDEPCISR